MRWFRRKDHVPATQTKSVVLGLNDELSRILSLVESGTGATPSSALNLYDQSSAVSIPVNKIGDPFASLEPVLKIGDTIEEDHPVLDLLRRPSPFMTGELFLEALGKNFLVTGEAGIIATGIVNRPPLELFAISPANVSPNEGPGGIPNSYNITGSTAAGVYRYQSINGAARYIDGTMREFKQIRTFNTSNNSLLRGQSPLVSASREVRQHILGNTHNVSLLENGGRVSLVFHFEQDMNDDDFEEVKRRVRAQYGGSRQAGQIGVTAGGKLDIKEAGINNKDMDFANLQRMARDAVALQYKVPLPLLSTDAATFNNYREAKLALYDDAVLPLADRIFAGLSDFLLPRFGVDPSKARITYDMDSITALATRRNEELKLRRDLNLESTNELRALLGREAADNGDQILIPANMVPLATDAFTDDNLRVVRTDEGPME